MELHVRIVSARNLHDAQIFGKQDPYCRVKCGHRQFKTKTHDNGGRTPHWNEKFVFNVIDAQLEQIEIEIMDSNFVDDDYIGTCRIPVSMFTHGQIVDQWFPVNKGKKQRGEVNLRVQLFGYGGQGMGHVAPQAGYAQPGYPPQGYAPQMNPSQGYAPPMNPYAQQQNGAMMQQQQQIQQQQFQIQQQQAQMAQQQANMATSQRMMYPPQAPPMMMVPPPVVMAPPQVVMAPPQVVMAPPPQVIYGAPHNAYYGQYGYEKHHHHHDGGFFD